MFSRSCGRQETIAALVLVFGAIALVDGTFAVVASIAGHALTPYWWVLLLQGLLGIGVGALTLFNPAITAVALLIYIAVWAIGMGVLQVIAAVRLRPTPGEWWLALDGIATSCGRMIRNAGRSSVWAIGTLVGVMHALPRLHAAELSVAARRVAAKREATALPVASAEAVTHWRSHAPSRAAARAQPDFKRHRSGGGCARSAENLHGPRADVATDRGHRRRPSGREGPPVGRSVRGVRVRRGARGRVTRHVPRGRA